ncbi:hypothetical protein D9M68_920480 [compost metagenome]
MFNFIGWIIIGAALGFYRAWKKTSVSFNHAIETVKTTPGDKIARARAMGEIQGNRIAALAIYSFIGAIIGALIWLAAWGVVTLIN